MLHKSLDGAPVASFNVSKQSCVLPSNCSIPKSPPKPAAARLEALAPSTETHPGVHAVSVCQCVCVCVCMYYMF